MKGLLTRTTTVLALLAVAIGTLGASALAVTPAETREAYVEQVEPICKRNTEANDKVLKGVRGKIVKGEMQSAARQVAKAVSAFEKALRQLRAVKPAPADSATVSRWLSKLDEQQKLLRDLHKAIKEEKRPLVTRLQAFLTRNADAANRVVLGFDFRYCRIDASKFT